MLPAQGADNDIIVQELKQEVENLKGKCDSLESRLQKLESRWDTHERYIENNRVQILRLFGEHQEPLDTSYQGEDIELTQ